MSFEYRDIASLDYFDSRDVVERVAKIESLPDWSRDAELRLERLVLVGVLDELLEYFPASKWSDVRTDVNNGVSGFAEHYAEDWAEEFAYDTGAVERGSWVERFIDWEKVADSLKEDYYEVEILGSTFYLQS